LGAWDEDNARALDALRRHTASRLLDALAELRPLPGLRLLDIGCGPGWFLGAAGERGVVARGVEADGAMAQRARAAGLVVATGLFPAAVARECYDAISMNDVFEHLPDPLAAVAELDGQLAANGLLLLNLPTRRGAFYRMAEALARLGIAAPLARLWQRGFVSPHRYYFDADALDRLLATRGFRCVRAFTLPSIMARGLWARVTEDRRLPIPVAALIYCGALLYLPLQRWLPADIMVRIYRNAKGVVAAS
jgi:SAM-dependent methyltransferase